VLRKALKAADLPPEEAARVASTVFTYYRWLGWLENERGIEARLRRAMELAARFAKNPFSLPAGHLRAKAVPQWVWSEVPLNDPWLRTIQREPKLWLRARPGQGRALAKSLGDCKRFGEGPLADALQYTGRKDLFLPSSDFIVGEDRVFHRRTGSGFCSFRSCGSPERWT